MCYHLAMSASDNFILMNLCHIFIILCISFCLFIFVFLSLLCVSLMDLPPPLIYNAITFYFFIYVCCLFPNIAPLPTNNKQQTVKVPNDFYIVLL